ncbi:MAG: DNA adenine methylase [Chitinophagaceae bacterium]|nr:DNA adenine methylase [Chitinophagaceae bacterium]
MPETSLNYYSPLRYPGGKRNFVPLFVNVFEKSELSIKSYYEFYAGGAGAALELLLKGYVKKIVLNDADFHIYAFWDSVLRDTDNFLRKITDTKITIDEWRKQKQIYQNFHHEDILNVGFSTFFLNRTNRSGILSKAGPIGGHMQNGNFKLDVRFHKTNLSNLITRIADNSAKISLYNEDAITLMKRLRLELQRRTSFLFLDPPYFEKGKNLYLNFYELENHIELKTFLEKHLSWNWILSYDNSPAIFRLYQKFPKRIFQIKYSLQDKKNAKEIVVFSNPLINSKNKRNIFVR